MQIELTSNLFLDGTFLSCDLVTKKNMNFEEKLLIKVGNDKKNITLQL